MTCLGVMVTQALYPVAVFSEAVVVQTAHEVELGADPGVVDFACVAEGGC